MTTTTDRKSAGGDHAATATPDLPTTRVGVLAGLTTWLGTFA